MKVGSSHAGMSACDLLAERSRLSKSKIKDAMNKGVVRLVRKRGANTRLRRASYRVSEGEWLELYYDDEILAKQPPEASCLYFDSQYSIWYKPAGLLTQGTQYGDHFALERQVEKFLKPPAQVFIVHRLDREAAGLVLICHSREAAALFSEMFRNGSIHKEYRVVVQGKMVSTGRGSVKFALDNKTALTEYVVQSYDSDADTTSLVVRIITGRRHQIRRHFQMIGHPVMGDPLYGVGNKNREGLKLKATVLGFTCPFSRRDVVFELDQLLNVKGEV
jgi:tRNA pseudouridine32 synthase/23S rRNA pseudouridine746 synthase